MPFFIFSSYPPSFEFVQDFFTEVSRCPGHLAQSDSCTTTSLSNLSQLSKKVPPGLVVVGFLLFNWKRVSPPLIILGTLKLKSWQVILIFLTTPPISIATLVCPQNYCYATRQIEGPWPAVLPPSILGNAFGGLDILKRLRREHQFGDSRF